MGPDASDRLYIMPGLSFDEDAEWLDSEKKEARKWYSRPFDAHGEDDIQKIYHIHLSKTSQAGQTHILLVGAVKPGGTVQNYTVNLDPDQTSGLWEYFQTAEDYDTMHDLHMGQPENTRFPGIYQLYSRDKTLSLTFTPTRSTFGPPTVLKLTPPEGAGALAVLPRQDSKYTDLFSCKSARRCTAASSKFWAIFWTRWNSSSKPI